MTPTLRVLVVDDDRICRQTTARQLLNNGYSVQAVDNPMAALALLDRQAFDIVLSDLRMPGMDGLTFLRQARIKVADLDSIVMTAYGTVESAVTAMREGATDYLIKPFPFQELNIRLHRLQEARAQRSELARLRTMLDTSPLNGIVGGSEAMRKVSERIDIFAAHTAPVLVTGQTGTGKELVARAIHSRGPRRQRPFVAIGSGAVPRDLAESMFFGHERGAFTGASQARKGAFEQANGGTLLLDDVDDLPLDLQAKLLRALQEGEITRVGSDRSIPVDVRIVATTKVDLQQHITQGHFRSDLYYRLRGMEISLPALRDRGDDVILLANHFLRLIAGATQRPPATLSDAAHRLLRQYAWPGNVRELRRAMEAADALAHGQTILPYHLPPALTTALAGTHTNHPVFSLHMNGVESVNLGELVRVFEEGLISWAMRQTDGQQTQAAERLSVPRTTLQSKLARMDEQD